MRFEAKTKQQIQDEKTLPEGVYPFKVTKAVDGRSKKGDEMIALTLQCYQDNGPARLVNDRLGAWAFGQEKILNFCEATGIVELYASGIFSATDCEGLEGYVKLGIETSDQYGTKNVVKNYVPEPAKAQPAPKPSSLRLVPEPVAAGANDVPF